ncbi:MAG: DNA-binding protein WhiA [Lachnospiraceae bacterium]
MSFSGEVKEEIENHISTSRHCQIAEMAAYTVNFGTEAEDKKSFIWQSEREAVLRKVFTLLKKTYNIYSVVETVEQGFTARENAYRIILSEEEELRKVLQSVHYVQMQEKTVSDLLLKKDCCRRAFLRGSFLSLGSMSDPAKSYHMEFVCSENMQAEQLMRIIGTFGIDAKITQRKHHFVVYIKEGEAIVDLLNIMGAHRSLMDLENLRIVKEVRNNVNRRVNCETANLSKTVNAAGRQLEDIIYLRDNYGLHKLPVHLREMAEVRLEHEDASLKELGEYLDPPVGKSGVNHRLRKLSELADNIKNSI